MVDRRQFIIGTFASAATVAGCSASPPSEQLERGALAPSTDVAAAGEPVTIAPPPALPTVTPSPPAPSPTLSLTPTATPTQLAPSPTPSVPPSPTIAPPSVTPTPAEIAQPANPGPQAWMQAAVEMRRISIATGDQAYGAIIVMAGRIVGLGVSKVVVNRDPTAHAEMEAIRDACRRLGTADLSGSTMYSTSRPCCMCETAAAYARVSRMVYGAGLTDAGAPRACGS